MTPLGKMVSLLISAVLLLASCNSTGQQVKPKPKASSNIQGKWHYDLKSMDKDTQLGLLFTTFAGEKPLPHVQVTEDSLRIQEESKVLKSYPLAYENGQYYVINNEGERARLTLHKKEGKEQRLKMQTDEAKVMLQKAPQKQD